MRPGDPLLGGRVVAALRRVRESLPGSEQFVAVAMALLMAGSVVAVPASTALASSAGSPIQSGSAPVVPRSTADAATADATTADAATASPPTKCDDPLDTGQGGVDDNQGRSGSSPVEINDHSADPLEDTTVGQLVPTAGKQCATTVYDYPDYVEGITLRLKSPAGTDYDLFVTLDGRRATWSNYDLRTSKGAGQVETITLDEDDIPTDGKIGIAVRVYDKNAKSTPGGPGGPGGPSSPGGGAPGSCSPPCIIDEYTVGPPDAKINLTAADSVRPDEIFRLNASDSEVPNGSPSYEWTVDGSTVSTEETFAYEFPDDATGSHTIGLTVTGGEGYTDTTTTTIEVTGEPVPDVKPRIDVLDPTGAPVHLREQVTFSADQSVCTEGTITSYEWSLPGTTSSGESVDHRFQSKGTSTVQLTVNCERYSFLGGSSVSQSTSTTVEVKVPKFKVVKVDQKTPIISPLSTLVGCDNLGVTTATVTGTQDAETVKFNIGKKTMVGEKMADHGRSEVYHIDRADIHSEDPPWADRNSENGFSEDYSRETVEVVAESTKGLTDRKSAKMHFTQLPGMLSVTNIAGGSSQMRGGGRCQFMFMVALLGSPPEASQDAVEEGTSSNPARDGNDPASSYDDMTGGSGYGSASTAKPGQIGPLFPKQWANSLPVIDDWTLGVGALVKYEADGEGEMGTLSFGGLVYGRVAGGTGIEGNLFVLGIMAAGFDVSNNLKFNLGKVWSIIIVQGELDLSSLFTGPLPYELNVLGKEFTIDAPIWFDLSSGAKVIATIGKNGDVPPVPEIDWSEDVYAKMKGNPIFSATLGLGWEEESLPCNCELSASGELELDTDYFQIYNEFAPNGIDFNVNFDVRIVACYKTLSICPLTWKKRVMHWEVEELGQLRADSVSGTSGRSQAVFAPTNMQSRDGGTAIRKYATEKRSGPSPAKALLGSQDEEGIDAVRSVTPR